MQISFSDIKFNLLKYKNFENIILNFFNRFGIAVKQKSISEYIIIDTYLFSQKIGIRYSTNKNYKLSIISSYQRYVKNSDKNILTDKEYIKILDCEYWFTNKLDRKDTVCPCLYLDVVDVRYDGIEDVYDIIDVPNHSFLSNGIVVHNCTTYMGRTNIEIVADTIQKKYKGELVYGDTDSNYIHFEHLKTSQESWDYALKVADEVSALFPPPIKLDFEAAIYWRFAILSKKRYMYKSCGRDGVVDEKIGRRGVLIARRDNSVFIRNLYEQIIKFVFDNLKRDDMLYFLIQELNNLCSNTLDKKNFVITKAVGDTGGMQLVPFTNEKGVRKVKVGSYILPLLPKEKEERESQLAKKDVTNEKDYYKKCLPAVVQLAEKMRNRGMRVDNGSRLEYVITDTYNKNDKQYDKLESIEYFNNHSDILKIDFMYYLKLLINPLDEVLNIVYKDDPKFKKDFIAEQYKIRNNRIKVLNDIKGLFEPKIQFV